MVTLGGRNTYSGATVIESGILSLGVENALGRATRVVVSGGELRLGETKQVVDVLSLEGGAIRGGRMEIGRTGLKSGVMDTVLLGAGSVEKTGVGEVVLSGRVEVSGGMTISEGRVKLGRADRIGDLVRLTREGGVLDLNGTTETVGRVRLRGGEVVNGSLFGTMYEVESGRIGTSLGGSGGLVKTTTGEVVLDGVNRYSGETLVEAGVLRAGVNGALPEATSVEVSVGAELALGLTRQTVEVLRVKGGLVSGGELRAREVVVESGSVSSVLGGSGRLVKSGSGEGFAYRDWETDRKSTRLNSSHRL